MIDFILGLDIERVFGLMISFAGMFIVFSLAVIALALFMNRIK